MVILRSQNKITDFFMILAWASPFKIKISTILWGILAGIAVGGIVWVAINYIDLYCPLSRAVQKVPLIMTLTIHLNRPLGLQYIMRDNIRK